ncbi:uncharacterized protein [Drosophila kikkawai]|uniref:Zinc finger protein 333 n=1 Tax=Drosophila kikkawai TaxID=30033 RepID=A0A6P4IR52_DROKI|nr:zinc finger protein 333 [Drosophila kikkawai]XP_017025322.1 zinc finger protein 333 [Drosophila kikkawai]
MEVCGSILTNSNYQVFRLKCLYCTIESELKDWEAFTVHVRTAHFCEEEEDCKDTVKLEGEGGDAFADSQDFCFPNDSTDQHIVYEPDELFDVIETVEDVGDDHWIVTDDQKQAFDNTSDDFYWPDPSGEFPNDVKPDDAPDTTPVTLYPKNDQFTDDMIIYASDSSMSGPEVVDIPKRPGRPPKRKRPGQVYKFKVSFIRSNPRVLHLIQAYKDHPCLWNPSHEHYTDATVRSKAYDVIMKYMNSRANVLFTVEQLKKTIQDLHIQYTMACQAKENGKLVGLAARYMAKSEYLAVSPKVLPREEVENDELNVIKLNFKTENVMTTAFIETYANYPQLYNPLSPEFGFVEARAVAYRQMAQEFQAVAKANETDIYIAVGRLRRWVYDAMRRLKSKELIQKCTRQEVEYLQLCNFLPSKGSESQILFCEFCDKRFHGDYNLLVHMYKAHAVGELPYLCSLCPRRFDRQVDMERHKLRSHFERKLKCQYCDKVFAVDNDLKAHTLIHTGEKPHTCSICGKSFRLKLLLDHHINGYHLNLRPFHCEFCNKSFRKKFELDNHIKGHLNIRDKKCEQCDATFYDHSSLSRHRRTHK